LSYWGPSRAATRKIKVGQNILRRECKRKFGGQKYTNYNKMNNNLKNFREGKIAARDHIRNIELRQQPAELMRWRAVCNSISDLAGRDLNCRPPDSKQAG